MVSIRLRKLSKFFLDTKHKYAIMPTEKPNIKDQFCRECGQKMQYRLPADDTLYRHICKGCGYIDYRNPTPLVACFATHQDKLLWMRRRHPPMAGYWFVPSGFMELGETPEEATSRELLEETGATIKPDNLHFFLIGSMPAADELYLAYRGQIDDISTIKITDEAMEVGFFSAAEAPWDKLAFPIAIETFNLLYKDLAADRHRAYSAKIVNNQHTIKPIKSS